MKAVRRKEGEMATEKVLQGLCDLMCGGDDPRADWDAEGCERFNEKDKQVIDHNMPPACLKVCGNCEYFTVWHALKESKDENPPS